MLSRIFARAHSTLAHTARQNVTTSTLYNTHIAKRYEFNWRKYINEKVYPEFATREYRQMEAELAELRTAAADADKVVEPIDWSSWESQIDDKEALQAIRKEYENMKFPVSKSLDLSVVNKQFEEFFAHSDKINKMVREDLVELEEQLVIAKEHHEEYPNYTFWDHVRHNPGSLEQLAQEHDEGYIVPTPSEWDWFMDKPYGKMREAFNNNTKFPAFPVNMPFVWGQIDARAEYEHYLKFEEETFGDLPGYWTEYRPYFDAQDQMKAYFAAYDAIDEEVAHFSAYAPEGAH